MGAFRTAGPAGRGPLRGFPPAPGAPDPVYPPGQFSPWNPPAVRSAGPGGRPEARSWPNAAAEPGYSLLAVSDPSADMTATQTWAVLDAAQLGDGWADPTATGGAQAATGTGSGLTQGGAYPWDQDVADPWPASPADAQADAPATAWANGPAEAAAPPVPEPGRQSPRRGRASRRAGAADPPANAQWPGDEEATGQFPAAAGTTGRYQADAGTTGRYQADADATGPYHADADATGPYDADEEPTGRYDVDAEPTAVRSVARRDAGTRVSRAAARGRKPRKTPSRARVWLLPILMALAVGTLVTLAYLHFVKGQASGARASTAPRTTVASNSPAPSLGPWKHITTRTEDPIPLTLTELFPAQFSSGGTTGTRTIDQAGTDCPAAVLGATLQAAVHKPGCTQVMRASYITTSQQIMGTIGVLNLADATASQRAGQTTGAAEFIDQLPAAQGPTHNLTKGTGLEEAVYKGHYLILIWAEFSNLHTPTTATQRAQLKTFSDNLVSGTANVSLTSRMVIGKPQT